MKNNLMARQKIIAYLKPLNLSTMTILLTLFFSFFQLQAGDSQKELKVSISLENKEIKEVLKELERQTGISFFYVTNEIDVDRKVSIHFSKTSLGVILHELFQNTNVVYVIRGKQIVLKKVQDLDKVEKKSWMEEKEKDFEFLQSLTSTKSIKVDFKSVARVNVKGKVTNEEKEGLPGVSVVVKGTTIGTTTDIEGNYSLEVPEEQSILVFSFIGYLSEELPVNNQTIINVSLLPDMQSLSEVVVIGYGTQRRADVTSAVATVKAKDFVKGPVQDAGQLLQGKVAGLSIANTSGNPTAGSQILLRGNTTLFGSNLNPLVIIDGIPGDLKTVAPEDIESVDVLKDGSAAAIYGVRGSNGVIIITTKRAKGTATNSVDYSGFVSTQRIARKLDMLTAQDYRDQIAAGTRGASWDAGSDTDWLKEATQTPLTHVHNLTIRGGNSTTNYLASGNYRALQGIFKESDNNTFTGRIDVNHSMWDNKLKFNIGILNQNNNYTKNSNGGDRYNGGDSFNGWIYRQTVIRNPTEPVRNADGDFYEQTGNFDYENPLALIYENDGESKRVNSRINGTIIYSPISNLKLSALLSYSRFNANTGYSESKKHISTIKSSLNGFASTGAGLFIDRLAEVTAEYNKSIEDHSFGILGGYGYQENESSGTYSSNQDFPTDIFSYHNIGLGEGINDKRAVISSFKTESNLISFFGRVNYSYKEKYLLLASLRREGASQLYGANNPWGNFWAVSGGWRITSENFMKNQNLFSDIKLRVGYGITGNQPRDGFLAKPLLRYGDYVYSNGSWTRILVPATNANPSIRWEEKHETNLGLDFSMLQGRIGGSVDLYKRQIKGLLYDYQVPSPPNLYNITKANVGKMENKGIEIMLNFVPIQSGDFVWNSSINFSTNSNKLVSLSNDLYQTTSDHFETGHAGVPIQTFTHSVTIGKGIGDFYGYKVVDIDQNGKWIYEGKNGEQVNYDDLGHTFEDKKVIGNGLPNYYAGWNNTISYKNLDLSVTMRGAFDYQIINSQRMYMENPAIQNYNILKSAYDPVFGKAVLNVPALELNSYYVEDGDFWKIDNVTLGYNFDNLNTKYLKGARVYVSTLNTLTITKYKGLDPEVNRMDLNPGVDDRDKYPTTRTFTLGVNLNF